MNQTPMDNSHTDSTPMTVIPLPREIQPAGGSFLLKRDLQIRIRGGSPALSVFLRETEEWFSRALGRTVHPVYPDNSGTAKNDLEETLLFDLDPQKADSGGEGYELQIRPRMIHIRAAAPAGLFYGFQTLRQMLPAQWENAPGAGNPEPAVFLPVLDMKDYPRYAFRGAMLDVVRHFFTVDEVCRYIDLLSLYKINRLHLHLSDDQGFRLEIPGLPELKKISAPTQAGEGPGGIYTREDFLTLLEHAQNRHIEIIPEIDMPGHTNAILAAFPSLNAGGKAPEPYRGTGVGFSFLDPDNPETWRILDIILTQTAALCPGPWLHIGGDEVKKLSNEQYRRFINRALSLTAQKGKTAVCYSEAGTAELIPGTLVQYWHPDHRELTREAAKKGARIILSPADRIYLDMKYREDFPLGLDWAGTVSVRQSRSWEPEDLIPGLDPGAIAGIEAPLWTETVKNLDDLGLLVLPRLPGAAETGWSSRGISWEDYSARLVCHEKRWKELGFSYYKSPELPR